MTEREAQGFSMEIDHYRPQNDGGTDAYENLYYSCRPCNRRKGAWVPSPVRANLIQIDKVHPDDHLELAPGGESLSALSDSGTASIEIVDLNRYSLRQLRLLRAKHEQSRRVITHGLRTLRDFPIDALPPKNRLDLLRCLKMAEDREAQLAKLLEDQCASPLLPPAGLAIAAHLLKIGAFLPQTPAAQTSSKETLQHVKTKKRTRPR